MSGMVRTLKAASSIAESEPQRARDLPSSIGLPQAAWLLPSPLLWLKPCPLEPGRKSSLNKSQDRQAVLHEGTMVGGGAVPYVAENHQGGHTFFRASQRLCAIVSAGSSSLPPKNIF